MKAINWKAVDWSKDTDAIMRETGYSRTHVCRRRNEIAPETKRNPGKRGQRAPRVTRNCPNCGGQFTRLKSRGIKYCSVQCARDSHGPKISARGGWQANRNEQRWRDAVKSEKHRDKLSQVQSGRKKRGRNAEGKENFKALDFYVRSPSNQIFHVENVQHFVRENPELFLPEDVEIKKWKSGRRGVNKGCRAATGFYMINRGLRGSWKGWTKVSRVEFHRGLADLLNRKSADSPKNR